MNSNSSKLITIVGPTASGKTALAIELAEQFDGEIVCADSRTIYRGMDIGTAKPTSTELRRVPHHLLDLVDPGEVLSVAAYKILAEEAIADIARRGRQPFLVGGSGLYIDAVLFDYQFPAPADLAYRTRLEAMTDDQLQELLAAADPEAFAGVDLRNRRRVMRAIETAGQPKRRAAEQRPQTLVVGLLPNKDIIQERMLQRIEKNLSEGIIDEVRHIGETYGWDSEAMSGNAYRAFRGVITDEKTIVEAKADNLRADMALYKKQLTWFRRNRSIKWVGEAGEARALVTTFLASTV